MNRELHDALAASGRLMTDALRDSRALIGKKTKEFHYSNEHLACNEAVTGKRKPAAELDMTLDQMEQLVEVRTANAWLIRCGLSYAERKTNLFRFATTERGRLIPEASTAPLGA